MSACTIIFVRHGLTDWNRAGRFQGQIDIPLNAEGIEQAERTGAVFREDRIDAVYSSDLARARQTAEPISRATGLPVLLESGLRERRYGVLEGRTHDEVLRDHPDTYGRWRARDPDFVLPGGGESLRELHRRVADQMRALAASHAGQTIVAVTHGGVLDCIYRIAARLPLEAPRSFDLRNASLNRVRWDGAGFSVASWGDVAHLEASRDDIEP
jgi:probable phosphoglycerate mutase